MYLNNSGTLNLIRNNDGFNMGSYGIGDAFGVSGTVVVGGESYCVLAGTNSGVRALRLADGASFPLGSVTNYDFTDVTGLDVFLRPGGTTTSNLAVAFVRDWPQVDIYSDGALINSFQPAVSAGLVHDLSFDVTANSVWYGIERTTTQGRLTDESFGCSAYAVSAPTAAGEEMSRKATWRPASRRSPNRGRMAEGLARSRGDFGLRRQSAAATALSPAR